MEQWVDIEGYEGLYQISNEGKVKSLARDVEWNGTIRHQPECILKSADRGKGYMFVTLCKDGKKKNHQVHRLVAQAFIENPEGLPQVNHKDEDKTNNSVFVNEDGSVDFSKSNLEWCTHEYNTNYGTHNARVAEAQRGMSKPWVAEAHSIPVDMLTKDGEPIRTFSSFMEAERYLRINGYPSASVSNINGCCKGNRSIAYGFKWQYSKQKELSN